MSRFRRINVALAMEETGLVPLFRHPDVQVCREVIAACHAGGARVFEFTNRGDFAHEVFAEVMKWVRTTLPDMMIGAGSVSDAPTAAIFMQMGADFIVAPSLNPEVARICNRRKVLWIPGCGTVTEISQAEELGAEIVKIFLATPWEDHRLSKLLKVHAPGPASCPQAVLNLQPKALKSGSPPA